MKVWKTVMLIVDVVLFLVIFISMLLSAGFSTRDAVSLWCAVGWLCAAVVQADKMIRIYLLPVLEMAAGKSEDCFPASAGMEGNKA